MNKIVCLYHKGCTDGTGGRYAVWKKFGDNAQYFACQYGQPLPDFQKDKDTFVIFTDYSTSRTELEALGEVCGKVLVLDHHQTAEEALKGCNHPNVEIVFDMNKSGAVLTWNYFHPNSGVPMLLQYVQDRDLWKFHLKGTEEVHAGISLLKGKMPAWNHYAFEEEELELLKSRGSAVLEDRRSSVEAQVPENVKVIQFKGYRAGILNRGDLVSEMGHAIYSDPTLNVDIGICWFVTKDNQVVLSMRSKQGTGPDVSELCKALGGGGHKNAAGCRVTLEHIQEILDGKWWCK
jgi:oligoribonuclease NrnB/cAMP/cGMP phosphodiesterase (DHH superfamily)